MSTVKPIPDGYNTLTVYLSVKGAARAIDFYKRALGAEEIYRMDMPDGRVGHAELQIGNSRLMLSDEMPEMPDIVCAHVETPTLQSQLGAKGVGEAGTAGAPGAVMNAINDALLPLNARVTAMPFTPERILKALKKVE